MYTSGGGASRHCCQRAAIYEPQENAKRENKPTSFFALKLFARFTAATYTQLARNSRVICFPNFVGVRRKFATGSFVYIGKWGKTDALVLHLARFMAFLVSRVRPEKQ